MNVPKVLWEGELKDEGVVQAIVIILRGLLGRRGRLLWVSTE